HVSGDHWYLLMLGVDPDQQGTGVGSAAIDAGAAKADLPSEWGRSYPEIRKSFWPPVFPKTKK
ncbi:MAG: GNAT family N-acetyltransferase, partial [Desulfobacterales bacterium]